MSTTTTGTSAVPGQRGAARAPFLATTDGFAFRNSWPSQPAVVFTTPFGKIDVGNAKGGLCGGMVFAALDYWHADVTSPADQPAAGAPPGEAIESLAKEPRGRLGAEEAAHGFGQHRLRLALVGAGQRHRANPAALLVGAPGLAEPLAAQDAAALGQQVVERESNTMVQRAGQAQGRQFEWFQSDWLKCAAFGHRPGQPAAARRRPGRWEPPLC